ncbi:MAG: hypothetical protein KF830_02475 [Planctomycetes bacterium]|nr:hypothetical protein [Planctomycetota bacterium]
MFWAMELGARGGGAANSGEGLSRSPSAGQLHRRAAAGRRARAGSAPPFAWPAGRGSGPHGPADDCPSKQPARPGFTIGDGFRLGIGFALASALVALLSTLVWVFVLAGSLGFAAARGA